MGRKRLVCTWKRTPHTFFSPFNKNRRPFHSPSSFLSPPPAPYTCLPFPLTCPCTLAARKIFFTAAEISGPMPSPGIMATVNFCCGGRGREVRKKRKSTQLYPLLFFTYIMSDYKNIHRLCLSVESLSSPNIPPLGQQRRWRRGEHLGEGRKPFLLFKLHSSVRHFPLVLFSCTDS